VFDVFFIVGERGASQQLRLQKQEPEDPGKGSGLGGCRQLAGLARGKRAEGAGRGGNRTKGKAGGKAVARVATA